MPKFTISNETSQELVTIPAAIMDEVKGGTKLQQLAHARAILFQAIGVLSVDFNTEQDVESAKVQKRIREDQSVAQAAFNAAEKAKAAK